MDDELRRRMFLVKADVDMPDATLRGLRAAAPADLGIDAVGFGKRLEGGTFHRLFEAHDAPGLVRVAAFPGAPWTGLMEMEAGLAAFLRARGFPVPACRFELAGGRGLQYVELVQGETASTRDDDEALTLARLESVARFLARLHGISGEGFGPVRMEGGMPRGLFESWDEFVRLRLAEHVAVSARSGAVTADEATGIEALFERFSPETEPALLHGDPGGHNFLVDGTEVVGVIDWEDAMLGDPLFDLASLCTFQPERRHARILTAYGISLEGESARRFWLYFLRIALAKTVHRARFGYADAPGRAPAARRIQLALDRLHGFASP